jgi:molybdopterin molybdotransferase
VAEELIDLEDARARVLAQASPLDAELVALASALDRVLAGDVVATEDVPGFDNSAMDGYAVVAADTAGAAGRPVRVPVVDESRAGRPARRRLSPGAAIRISTGARVPRGADAVVRVEDTVERDGAIEIHDAVEPGRNLRRAGEDVRAGAAVLRGGTPIGPAELGVLASVGADPVRCVRRPRVAVLTTGDELRGPRASLEPGQVRNTNAYAVPAQAHRAGGEVVRVETVPDDRDATVEALGRGLQADVLVICGGVSVGVHDEVKPALERLGVRPAFWGVALRPGKPTWFGVHRDRTLVFGLPGNPVSAMVTFHLLARPALAALAGSDPAATRVTATFDADYPKRPGRAHAVRCRLEVRDDGWHVRPTGEQGSHILTSMLEAQALALLERQRGNVSAGERVTAELLGVPRDRGEAPSCAARASWRPGGGSA